jgi:hypothetical protein
LCPGIARKGRDTKRNTRYGGEVKGKEGGGSGLQPDLDVDNDPTLTAKKTLKNRSFFRVHLL